MLSSCGEQLPLMLENLQLPLVLEHAADLPNTVTVLLLVPAFVSHLAC